MMLAKNVTSLVSSKARKLQFSTANICDQITYNIEIILRLAGQLGWYNYVLPRIDVKSKMLNTGFVFLKNVHIRTLIHFYINLGIAVIFTTFFFFKNFQKLINIVPIFNPGYLPIFAVDTSLKPFLRITHQNDNFQAYNSLTLKSLAERSESRK